MIPTTQTVLKTLTRALPDRTFTVARVGLDKLDGNRQAYWTATADVYEPHGTWSGRARYDNEREADMCGSTHGAILRAFPKLAPIVALHLSDPDGVPMYALANGRYHLANGDRQTAAKLWRCDIAELPEIEDVESFIEAQRERWARESAHAWELLQSIEGGS
jgi:hypothetical protein